VKGDIPAGSTGFVYSETVVWAAPTAFLDEAPYQLAIVEREGGERVTARIAGERVAIDDRVRFVEHRNGVLFFEKSEG
jgi:uncharacterized OB-fold protein